MSDADLLGLFFIFIGSLNLWKYFKRRQWQVVEGTLDSIDVKIDADVSPESGLSVCPKYIYKIQYIYLDRQYLFEFSDVEIPVEKVKLVKLKVNPEKPSEAFLDNQRVIFPIIALGIGIIFLIVSINS
jgi:hypothetical protein